MDSKLNDDERRRIAAFCDTPPYERDPELLVPGSEYADDVRLSADESERARSRLRSLAALCQRWSDHAVRLFGRR